MKKNQADKQKQLKNERHIFRTKFPVQIRGEKMKHTRTEQILNIKVLMVLQNKNMSTVYFLLLFNGKFIPHSNIKKYSVMSTTEPPSVFSISE